MVTPPPSPNRADGACAAAIPTTAVQHTASKLSIRRCIARPPGEVWLWLPYRPVPTRRCRSMIRSHAVWRSFPPATRAQLVVAVGGGSVTPADNPDAVMGSHPRHEVVVPDHTDRPVGLEHGEHYVLDVRDAVFAQRLDQLVARDPAATQVRLEDIAVVDQHDAFAGEQLREAAGPLPPPVDHAVPGDQYARRDESAREARVGADHRVLDGVRDDEEEHQIEGGHLAQLARAREPEPGEKGKIDDGRADRDVEQGVPGS